MAADEVDHLKQAMSLLEWIGDPTAEPTGDPPEAMVPVVTAVAQIHSNLAIAEELRSIRESFVSAAPSARAPQTHDDARRWTIGTVEVMPVSSHPPERSVLERVAGGLEEWARHHEEQAKQASKKSKVEIELNTKAVVKYEVAQRLREEAEGLGEEDGFEHCKRCGRGNTIWGAPSPLWNAVIRGGSIDGDPIYGDLVCASCFIEIAEKAGIASHFRITAEQVNVELEMTTPSGRVWDENRQLWVDPDAALPPDPQETTEQITLWKCPECDQRFTAQPQWGCEHPVHAGSGVHGEHRARLVETAYVECVPETFVPLTSPRSSDLQEGGR